MGDEHAVDALDDPPSLVRRHTARLEGAAPVDRRATAAEVAEPYRRHVVGEGKGALQHRVGERMGSRIVGLETLANRLGPIAPDGAYGAAAPSLDGHPGPSGRPGAQVTEVGKARPYPFDGRVELIANPGSRHRGPPHGCWQLVTGAGSPPPVMRTAPNVDPSRRILSEGSPPKV